MKIEITNTSMEIDALLDDLNLKMIFESIKQIKTLTIGKRITIVIK